MNHTVRDIVKNWPKDETSRILLLKDCTSPVPGFEEASKKFIDDMINAGVVVDTSKNVILG